MIESGMVKTHYRWNSGHAMITKKGYRYVAAYVKYNLKYTKTPSVLSSLNYVDSSSSRNLRIHCYASHVSKNGFLMRIITWSDSRIYGAICGYVVHGN